jgi:hypothetical protein
MKKKLLMTLVLSFVLLSGIFTYAQETLTQEQFLTSYIKFLLPKTIPQSAKYIQVRYQNVPSPAMNHLLQQAIVLDMIPNAKITLDWKKPITQRQVAGRISLVQKKEITFEENLEANSQWIQAMLQSTTSLPTLIELSPQPLGQQIFDDVFQVVQTDHVDAKQFSGTELRYGAIKGLVGATNDIHTNFFTPKEASQFTDELAGEMQ